MLKRFLTVFLISGCYGLYAQQISLKETKKISVKADTITIFSKSINPNFFELKTSDNKKIDSTYYTIDFKKAKLIIDQKKYFPTDSLMVTFLKYPSFLTKTYAIFDDAKIVPNSNEQGSLYQFEKETTKSNIPFDGLNTSGSITRGITVGNNQNAVINSALDLQISGKLSNKISIRASIQDSNIPLQQGGYSQRLDEFDQVFVELFSDKWNLRAGDLFLENRQSQFLNFNKKVQGISALYNFGTSKKTTNVFASTALVRGQYARSVFTGQEGNQGPYRLRNQNDALFVLIVSGSERVFVNGTLLKRGENKDYIIDYNAGEIRFTNIFPITSEMRINVEYQFSDRSFTRFLTYAGATHQAEKWSLSSYIYSENDSKNQPLQQSLTEKQTQELSLAGDDSNRMVSQSAFEDSFANNKILYKKVITAGNEIFEFSMDETETLFNVRFSLVGENLGNYIISNNNSNGRIFQFVAPINGVRQGNYEPIVRLTPPTKIALASVVGKYNPSEKTLVDFELGVSDNDKNLFSTLDDKDNTGLAGKLNVKQRLFSRKWKIDYFGNLQFIQQRFTPIERIFSIEFNRDWNILNPVGNQLFLTSGISAVLGQKIALKYSFENLNFSESFTGNRQNFLLNVREKNMTINSVNNILKSEGSEANSSFLQSQTAAKYAFRKNWIGSSLSLENNSEILKSSGQLSNLSQKFSEVGAFIGRGDSTKVYAEFGVLRRLNDSLQAGIIKRVNQSTTYYVKSKLIESERSNLSVFANYRMLKFEDNLRPNIPSLNSRILYNTRFFGQFIQTNLTYETNSGTIAQQEFTYVEVDAGRGIYSWIDYNENGLQELQEFEMAQFTDEAKFIRIFLPNQVFVNTHQNRFSQAFILNPNQWQNKNGWKKFISHFFNQTSLLMDRKILKNDANFDLNPFSNQTNNVLGQNANFRNSFFYNRGRQNHSVTYNYINNETKNLLAGGGQKNSLSSNQIQYQHLIKKSWLLQFEVQNSLSVSESDNFVLRNFRLDNISIIPKLSYLFSRVSSLEVFYDFQNKKNMIGALEMLQQHKLGLNFTYSTQKQFTINGDFNIISNKFEGISVSPVAFQMLEGLQPGRNFTWRLLLQKKLTSFLDINLNYQARKSEVSAVNQTGNIQLRAFF